MSRSSSSACRTTSSRSGSPPATWSGPRWSTWTGGAAVGRRWPRAAARGARGCLPRWRRSARRSSRSAAARPADGVPAPVLAARGRRPAGRLHRARRRDRVREGARLRDRRGRSRDGARGRPQAPGPRPHAVGDSGGHRRGRRQLRRRAPRGRGDGRLPSHAGRDRDRRRARQGIHDVAQPGAPQARRRDHGRRAPEAHRRRPAGRACRGGAGDHVGDRPAQRRRAPGPRRGHVGQHRRIRGHKPGGIPRPPREDRDLQRIRPARPPRRPGERGRAARPRAPGDRRRAVCRRAGARLGAGAAGGRPLHRHRGRHDRRRAGPRGRNRGDADVRPRRPGLHEVARRPPGPPVPARRGAQSRLCARAHDAGARRDRGDRGRRRGRLGRRRGARPRRACGRRPAAWKDLPLRRRLAAAGDGDGAARPALLEAPAVQPAAGGRGDAAGHGGVDHGRDEAARGSAGRHAAGPRLPGDRAPGRAGSARRRAPTGPSRDEAVASPRWPSSISTSTTRSPPRPPGSVGRRTSSWSSSSRPDPGSRPAGSTSGSWRARRSSAADGPRSSRPTPLPGRLRPPRASRAMAVRWRSRRPFSRAWPTAARVRQHPRSPCRPCRPRYGPLPARPRQQPRPPCRGMRPRPTPGGHSRRRRRIPARPGPTTGLGPERGRDAAPRSSHRRRNAAVIGLLVLAFVGVAGGAAAYLLLPTASIVLTVRSVPIPPVTFVVTADPDVTAPDAAAAVVPATRMDLPLTASGTFKASGKRVDEAPAVGTVRWTNCDPTRSYTIPGGTPVRTPAGIAFGTDEAVFLPVAILNPPQIACQNRTVTVTAAKTGTDANVAAGTITVIPGQYNSVVLSVTNPAPTSGGKRNSFPKVTQKDVTAALAALGKQLDAQLATAAAAPRVAVSGYAVLPAGSPGGAATATVDPATLVDQEVAQFDLGATATGTVVTVDPAPIVTLGQARVSAAVPADHDLVAGSPVVTVGPGTVDGQRVRFGVTARADAAPRVDESALRKQVEGRSALEAQAILGVFGDATVTLWPGWATTIPTFDARVDLRIDGAAGEAEGTPDADGPPASLAPAPSSSATPGVSAAPSGSAGPPASLAPAAPSASVASPAPSPSTAP